ncbi:MAG: hypothetical protein IJT41_03560 [Clostridia bacterium]|nr:hypothetical protein [Clostridia bacterium]
MVDYEQFARDYRSEYPTDEAMQAAYDRRMKAERDILLTPEEFKLETRTGPETDVSAVYRKLMDLLGNGAIRKHDVYYYAHYRWCLNAPEAIIAYETGPKNQWAVNNCDTELSAELAIDKINDEWRFERAYIEIVGTAYYESSDWNFIRFNVDGVSWLMHDGELYQVYE